MTRSIWGDEYGVLGARPVRRRRRAPFAGLIVLLLLITAAGAGLHYYASVAERPFWGVQRIEVRGNRAISEAELLAALDLRAGTPWWSAISMMGDRTAAALPRLARAQVSFAPPAGVRIQVSERAAILLLANNDTLGLAEDGMILPLSPGFDRIDLPYLTGHLPSCEPGRCLDLDQADDWWSQLAHVQAELPELWESISQIDYQGARDFQVFFRDRYILLWDSRRNAHLWDQVPLVLSRLRLDALAGDAVLDMRFRDRIVVRVPGEKLLEEEEPEGEKLLEDQLEDQKGAPDHAELHAEPDTEPNALAANVPGRARGVRGGR